MPKPTSGASFSRRSSFALSGGGGGKAYAQPDGPLTEEELDRHTSAYSLVVRWCDAELARNARDRGHPLLSALGARVDWVSDLMPGVAVVTLPNGNARVAAQLLRTDPEIEMVERDPFIKPATSPNDTFWPTQKQYLWPACLYGAWSVQTGTAVKKIGVLDSGANYNLVDLGPNIWLNLAEINGVTGVDDDSNGVKDDYRGASFFKDQSLPDWTPENDPLDLSGHGTAMSSIIGSVGNNDSTGVGYCGVNWTCTIVPVKIFGAGGSTQIDLASWALMGMEYAHKSGVRLMNCSWVLVIDFALLRQFMQQRTDCLFICGAGNVSINLDDPNPIRCGIPLGHYYPAEYSFDNMIVVGGADEFDQPWFAAECMSGSAFGATTVDIFASGGAALPTVNQHGAIEPSSGTSNSTALVTGVAGLVWAQNPTWSLTQVRQQILNTADQLPQLVGFCVLGRRLNAAAALGASSCE